MFENVMRCGKTILVAICVCALCVLAGYAIARLAENIGTQPMREEEAPRKLTSLVQMTCEFEQNDV